MEWRSVNLTVVAVLISTVTLLGRQSEALISSSVSIVSEPRYTRSWAVEIPGGTEVADGLARIHGFLNLGKVGNLENHYHFVLVEGCDRHMPQLTVLLMQENQVKYVEQQKVKSHVKKGYTAPQDPNWNDQWSLKNSGQFGGQPYLDLNVEPAWLQGFTGKGVVVAFVDDGLEKDHPDLRDNFDSKASHDFVDGDDDPTPDYSADDTKEPNRHGTSCAGEVGMGKNSDCGIGVAYESSIAGLRVDLAISSDVIEADSLGYMSDYIDIYSNSWGPADNGFTAEKPGYLLTQTFENGVTNGRNGKGSIYVWAAGNGGDRGDSCAADAYASSIYTIAVGSADERGRQAGYDEECSAKMVTTFSYNSKSNNREQISTTTLHGCCANDFTGTSAATPLVSGGIALALQANSNLTWRDVQYLLVYTSNTTSLTGGEWTTNGAGLRVSHKFGFGAIDVEALVTRAQRWTNVPKQHSKVFSAFQQNWTVCPRSSTTLTINVPNDSKLVYLEHVVVYMTLTVTGYSKGYSYFDLYELQQNSKNFDSNYVYEDFDAKENEQYYEFLTDSHPRRGDIQVTLTSPNGTVSVLLPYRDYDFINEVGYQDWPFMSVHYWGENPIGNWTVKVYYRSPLGEVQVTIQNMTLYGVMESPQAVYESSKCAHFRHASTLQCVSSCNESETTQYEKYCIDGTVVQTTNSRRDYSCGSGSNTALIIGLSVSFGLLLIGSIVVCLLLKVCCYCNRRKRARVVYGIVHADIDEDFDE